MSFWRERLAWPRHRLAEWVGLPSYTRTQRYEITYRLSLSARTSGDATLVIPLPRETSQQTVLELATQLPDAEEARDRVFGNRFLITTLYVSSGQMEVSAFRGRLEIRPNLSSAPGTLMSTKSGNEQPFLHPHDERIRILAERIGHGSCARDTAKRINAYIVDHLVYGDPIDDLYSDLDALTKPRVDCGGFDALFVSLCLAHGIPARVVSGFWLDGGKNDMHAWAEFQDEQGRWIPVDPSVEQMARRGRTRKSGRFGYVGSDRVILSVGSHLPIERNNRLFFAPILQHPFILNGSACVLSCRGEIHLARSADSIAPGGIHSTPTRI